MISIAVYQAMVAFNVLSRIREKMLSLAHVGR
jgi:hypothetical protein